MKTSSTLLFLGVCLLFINVVVGIDCTASGNNKVPNTAGDACVCDPGMPGLADDGSDCECDATQGLTEDSGICKCNPAITGLSGTGIDCKCDVVGKVLKDDGSACECDATQGLKADSGTGCECNTAIPGLTGTGIDCKCDVVGKVLKDDGSACECDTKSGWVDNKDGSACECEEGKVQTSSGTCEAKGGASSITSSTIMSILYPLVVAWSLKMISM